MRRSISSKQFLMFPYCSVYFTRCWTPSHHSTIIHHYPPLSITIPPLLRKKAARRNTEHLLRQGSLYCRERLFPIALSDPFATKASRSRRAVFSETPVIALYCLFVIEPFAST